MIPGPAGMLPEGGEAQLEADVMRFVAILALCLVAISTLVSTPPAATAPVVLPDAPLVPVMLPDAPATPGPAGVPRAPAPAVSSPAPPGPGDARVTPEPPAPDRLPDPAEPLPETPEPRPAFRAAAPTTPAVASTASRPESGSETPAPATAAAAGSSAATPNPPPARRGFVLRFESDAVLLRLAAAGRVGVYALRDGESLRLRMAAAGAEMVPAPTPARFHVMDTATVPAVLRAALPAPGEGRVWAVTLPETSRDALAGLMRRHEDGELVIGASGGVRRLAHVE